MAAHAVYLFENVEDEVAFTERRFHKSILFMKGINKNLPMVEESKEVTFAVYEVGDTKTYAATVGQPLPENLRLALNLEPVRVWRLIRRKDDVFFVGENSEAIVADSVVPMEIRVEGAQDAERCWSRA